METMERIRALLHQELEKAAQARELSGKDIECIGEIVDILKDMDEIERMDNGYSQRGGYDRMIDGGYYNGGYSYARGDMPRRDAMGRYSRDDGRERMIAQLDGMMQNAGTEQERERIRAWKMQLEHER